jgi:hypothetical protein
MILLRFNYHEITQPITPKTGYGIRERNDQLFSREFAVKRLRENPEPDLSEHDRRAIR